MQNYGYPQQPFVHLYFPNSGPYNVDFKISINNSPAVGVRHFSSPQHQNPYQQAIQYPGQFTHYPQPAPPQQQYCTPFDQRSQSQEGRGPCDRHHRIFCIAPECQPRSFLNDTSSVSSISEGGGVASTSWAYTGSRQALALNSGVQTTPFGTSQQQHYETVGSSRGAAWNASGQQFTSTPTGFGNANNGSMGHFSGYSTPSPQKTGCFPKKHCNMM